MKLAIVGIRGLPNSYGGFETLSEYLLEYLADDIHVTVYCSSRDMHSDLKEYKGAKLKYIPISSHGAMGILYDSISLIDSISKNDKILILGFGAGFVMPFLTKKAKQKIIVNIGGLDWKRSKWSKIAQKVIKNAEKLLLNNSGKIVSDNIGIQKYIKEEYGRNSSLIAYGGDQCHKQPITDDHLKDYPFLKQEYAFTVTRIQSDNNIEMILEAFKKQSNILFVLVGNWQNSDFGKQTKAKYENEKNLILLEAIYDLPKLNLLRSNCAIYVHGNSAGGTNPALVEAMYLGLPIFSYASGYNEHTTENKALYFKNCDELLKMLNIYKSLNLKEIGRELGRIAEQSYTWDKVSKEYERLITG